MYSVEIPKMQKEKAFEVCHVLEDYANLLKDRASIYFPGGEEGKAKEIGRVVELAKLLSDYAVAMHVYETYNVDKPENRK